MIHTRATVEMKGRLYPGYEVVDEYYKTKVLGRFDMYVNPNDKSVTPHLINDGFWEAWITTWMMNNVDDQTTFYDIGANTGYYSLLALSLGSVASIFEPNPEYAKMIKKSLNLQSCNSAVIHNIALSDSLGQAYLNIPKELHGSASLHDIPGYETNQIVVPMMRLDGIHNGGGVSKHIVKIDAEGHEEYIWRGMKGFLKPSERKKTVLLEYTPNMYTKDFLPSLREWGSIGWINYSGNEESVTDEWIKLLTDWQMLVIREK